MATLSSDRVTQSRPFLHVGKDFAGLLPIKEGYRKNARSTKYYLKVYMTIKTI